MFLANSSEFDGKTRYPVIDYLSGQKKDMAKGGTMRLGAYACKIHKGTIAEKIYKKKFSEERHRHRLEFNNKYKTAFQKAGMICSGINPSGLVEIVELKKHPYFIGVQFHPEFKSRPLNTHPIFDSFIAAALNRYLSKSK